MADWLLVGVIGPDEIVAGGAVSSSCSPFASVTGGNVLVSDSVSMSSEGSLAGWAVGLVDNPVVHAIRYYLFNYLFGHVCYPLSKP